jgi:predicted lipid-binding transport protein (Tim44 family)
MNGTWLWSGLGLGLLLLGGWGWRALARRSPGEAPSSRSFVTASRQEPTALTRGYSPMNVGNDASARPWEATADLSPSQSGAARGSARVPAGFDTEAFLSASKTHFVNLQAAWDRADIPSLRAVMTDAMLADIQVHLAERERQGVSDNRTEVVMLEARLLDIEEREGGHLASVEFSGLIREEPSAGPNPFREVWTISRAFGAGSGWLVNGVQALQ